MATAEAHVDVFRTPTPDVLTKHAYVIQRPGHPESVRWQVAVEVVVHETVAVFYVVKANGSEFPNIEVRVALSSGSYVHRILRYPRSLAILACAIFS